MAKDFPVGLLLVGNILTGILQELPRSNQSTRLILSWAEGWLPSECMLNARVTLIEDSRTGSAITPSRLPPAYEQRAGRKSAKQREKQVPPAAFQQTTGGPGGKQARGNIKMYPGSSTLEILMDAPTTRSQCKPTVGNQFHAFLRWTRTRGASATSDGQFTQNLEAIVAKESHC